MSLNMSKLYQYSINNIANVHDWMMKNKFNISSFKKVIVESLEQVQLTPDLDKALKERFIFKLRLFNEDYDFSISRNQEDAFNIIILTEKDLPYEEKQSYTIIKTEEGTNYCSYKNGSEFKTKKYICEPILVNKYKNPNILSVPELLVFHRIYKFISKVI